MDFENASRPISINNNSEIGVLIIHGFTSTVSSQRYIIDGLSKAGFNVEAPKLQGHGSNWQSLNSIKYTDWIDDIELSLNKLKNTSKKIFVFGLSMGGTLSLYLAENHQDLSGVIVVNNACKFNDPRLIILPLIKLFIKSTPAISNDIKDKNEKEIAYDRNPTKALHELMKLIKIVNKNLYKITIPTLIFKSKDDHIIPIKSAIFTLDNIGSTKKQLVWLENSYHVATQDYDKEIIINKTVSFIKENI